MKLKVATAIIVLFACLFLYSSARLKGESPTASPSLPPSNSPAASPVASLQASPSLTPSASPIVSPAVSPVASPSATPPAKDDYCGKTVLDSKMGSEMMRARNNNAPKVGDVAFDFDLKVLGKDEKMKLSSFKGKKHVVLVLSSYT